MDAKTKKELLENYEAIRLLKPFFDQMNDDLRRDNVQGQMMVAHAVNNLQKFLDGINRFIG